MRKKPERREFVFVVFVFAAHFALGCAGISKDHDYTRLGESCVVSNNTASVSNAIVRWSGTLTNGYSLLHDDEARHSYVGMLLKDDPHMLFMLMNRKESTAPWGISACNERRGGLFYATIVIRSKALDSGTRIAVAVHEFRVTDRLGFNVHTGFQRGRTVALEPCSKDDLQILQQIGKFLNGSPLRR